MTGLETIIVAEAPSPALTYDGEEKFYFNLEYKPDIATLGLRRLKELCTEGFTEDEPVEFFRDLHKFMMATILETIVTIQGSKSSVSAPHLQKYVSWMKMHLNYLKWYAEVSVDLTIPLDNLLSPPVVPYRLSRGSTRN